MSANLHWLAIKHGLDTYGSHLCNISIITAKSLMTELHNIVL